MDIGIGRTRYEVYTLLLQTSLTQVAECSRILEKMEPLSPQEQQLAWRYAIFFPNYGTVELGQSESRIFASSCSNSLRRSSSPKPIALSPDNRKGDSQSNDPPDIPVMRPVSHIGPQPPPTNMPLLSPTPVPHDWYNLFLDPSTAAGETSTVPLSSGSDNNIPRVSFPYLNFLGTLT